MKYCSLQKIWFVLFFIGIILASSSVMAQEDMLKRLISEDWNVRKAAREELPSLDPKIQRELIHRLVEISEEPDNRAGWIPVLTEEALIKIGLPAVPYILDLAKDPKYEMRGWAMHIIAKIRPVSDDVVRFALQEAKTKGCEYMVIEVLGQVSPTTPEIIQILKDNINNKESSSKAFALITLGKVRPVAKDAFPNIIKALDDPDQRIRAAAAEAFEQIDKEAEPAIQELVVRLGDPNACVRTKVSDALASIGENAVPALLQALKSSDIYVRYHAVDALAKIGPINPKMVSILISVLHDPNSRVRGCAAIALYRVNTPVVSNVLQEYRQEYLQRERQRERTLQLKEKADMKRLWTKSEIVAPLPADDENRYASELEYGYSFYGYNSGELFVTLHRGKDRLDRLVLWRKEGDKYRENMALSAREDSGANNFGRVEMFRYDGKLFIVVPLNFEGTAGYHEERIFCIQPPDNNLKEIQFQPAGGLYNDKLNPGESIQDAAWNTFKDNLMSFKFYIWKKDDGLHWPTAGQVEGTYKIANIKSSNYSDWKIVVDTYERKPIPPDM
jgi:HEAT repeat protein